jgi:hypothetical protein
VSALSILACSVCMGDKPSPLVDGAAAGVMVLAGCVDVLLAMIVTVTIYWIQRARMLEANEAYDRAGGGRPGALTDPALPLFGN